MITLINNQHNEICSMVPAAQRDRQYDPDLSAPFLLRTGEDGARNCEKVNSKIQILRQFLEVYSETIVATRFTHVT